MVYGCARIRLQLYTSTHVCTNLPPIMRRYARDPSLPCDEDVFKRSFCVAEGRIRLQFHLGAGRAASNSRTFSRTGAAVVVQARTTLTFTATLNPTLGAGRGLPRQSWQWWFLYETTDW